MKQTKSSFKKNISLLDIFVLFTYLSSTQVKEVPRKTQFAPGQQLSLIAAPIRPPRNRQVSPSPTHLSGATPCYTPFLSCESSSRTNKSRSMSQFKSLCLWVCHTFEWIKIEILKYKYFSTIGHSGLVLQPFLIHYKAFIF